MNGLGMIILTKYFIAGLFCSGSEKLKKMEDYSNGNLEEKSIKNAQSISWIAVVCRRFI
jgi:hypothetical protein